MAILISDPIFLSKIKATVQCMQSTNHLPVLPLQIQQLYSFLFIIQIGHTQEIICSKHLPFLNGIICLFINEFTIPLQWLGGKESACNAGDLGLIPASERSPGEGNGYHSSILAWRIPWTEEPGGLKSMGSQRVQHIEQLILSLVSHTFTVNK